VISMRIDTVLVANRGEIARRIIRTLREQGVRSVAVHSDADALAPHVREADDAVHIGGSPAAESYLNVDAIMAAVEATGAQAVHPGYGFLSESVALARACQAAGVIFIGPGERALEIMGDKARAREHVSRHGVPVVPGFDASGLDDDEIRARAQDVGYPLLVKPSAGGGGKGMEIVRSADELAAALATARRVARPPSAMTRWCSSASCSGPGTSRCRSSATRTATSSPSASASAPCSVVIRR